MIAALYVAKKGAYQGLADVDPWDEERDARKYDGPFAVVAHPPCTTWGAPCRQGWTHRGLGDDDGCFAAALASVRKWGGVLEHPAESSAWAAFGLPAPRRQGGWCADTLGGWTCHVEQGHYGHAAPKPTWLYACRVDPPGLLWGHCAAFGNQPSRFDSRGKRRPNTMVNMSSRQRAATPLPFRELLLSIARSVRP